MSIIRFCKDWFGGLQFKSKVIVVFLPLIVLSLFLLGLISTQIFSRSIIDRTKSNVEDQSALILSKLDSIISNAEICSNMIVSDLNRLYESYPAARSFVEETRMRNMLQSRLETDIAMFPEVDAAVFIDAGNRIHTTYDESGDEGQVLSSGMQEQLREMGSYGVSRWFPMQKRTFLTPDRNVPVLTLGKVITDIDTGRDYGTLFLLVKETTLSAFLGEHDESGEMGYYVVDERMTIAASPNQEILLHTVDNEAELELLRKSSGTVSAIRRNGDERELITVSDFSKMNGKLVHVVPMHLLTLDVEQNIKLIMLIGILCLGLSLLAVNVLSKVIVDPLLQLAKAMRRVMGGDLSVTAPVRTRDEVGLIAGAFNIMVARIHDLLNTVEREQVRKREYELALITAQVKPHFLYNTLDTIYVLNDMERNEEARDTTKSLADFYRMVLNKGRELIILEQEAKIVRDYLSIMQVRYPDVFRYELHIPAHLAGAPVPKLSLQPLVENAIYHGLKTKGEKGLITISAYAEEGRVKIRVEDNGVGMSEERIHAIMAFSDKEEGGRSIGIFSVQERLKLYFGEQFGITIQSTIGKGTVVEMSVPGPHSGGKDRV